MSRVYDIQYIMGKHVIGFFDSGIGGLSTMCECRKLVQNADFLYLADTANSPFGVKSREEIESITRFGIKKLIAFGADTVVIACNTATSAAIDEMRKEFDIQIIGAEPAVKLAEKFNKTCILVTPFTAKSDRFLRLILAAKNNVEVFSFGSLATEIEENIFCLKKTVDKLCEKVNFASFDAVILGCTHYVFLKHILSKRFENTSFIDGNQGIAKRLRSKIEDSFDDGQIYFFGNACEKDKYLKIYLENARNF